MEKITTRTACIYIDDNRVLHMELIDGVILDHEDALDNALVIKRFSKSGKVLKLIDARGNITINKKAREFINKVDERQTIARAVYVDSKLNSLIRNFFLELSKPKIPTKIFTEYENAYLWLLTFREE